MAKTTSSPTTRKSTKDINAVLLGRKGGLVGGNARATSLSADARSAIASQGGKARAAQIKHRKVPIPHK